LYSTGTGSRPAASYFAKNGYMTIAPDFLGYGGSDSESGNIFETRFQTYTTAISLLKAIEQMKSDKTVLSVSNAIENPSRISTRFSTFEYLNLWAHSNGGQIALTTLEVTKSSYPTTLWAPVTKGFPYSVLYYTPETGTGTSWYDTGLAITLTPKSANSRFLINVSLIAANGDAWGNSVGGLFKDSTPLINQFTSINSTRYDAFPSSTTYLDYDGSLTTRTYQIKIKGSEAGSRWYTNYSMDLGNLYNATSSMTILEIAY
jgi:hypothetical protein